MSLRNGDLPLIFFTVALSVFWGFVQSVVMILVWLRRDLRLDDNSALAMAQQLAQKNGEAVQPVFFFDPNILSRLADRTDRRVEFLHSAVEHLDQKLNTLGSGLICRHADPAEAFNQMLSQFKQAGQPVSAVVCARDYESYAMARDEKVKQLCNAHNAQFTTVKDHVVFESHEVRKDDGGPYTVYTPFMRKWKKVFEAEYTAKKKSPLFETIKSQSLNPRSPLHSEVPKLAEMGFEGTGFQFPSTAVKNETLIRYADQRDLPAEPGTTRLGLHLRFGTVSIRRLVQAAMHLKAETWLNELIWRDFFSQILQSFPHVEKRAFRPEFDRIQWREDQEAFERWSTGQTGVPIVDAGMRELIQTGFMHNRVRMIAGSYLVKNLLIDWRKGESVFARYLLDFDLASNNGNWQWVAGSGCDASPYFRIFNPELQAKRFDPKGIYIQKYVPELHSSRYPAPMIEQSEARARTLKAYSVVRDK